MKAVCSFSGGLDSILAIKLMQDQGIEVEAVHFDNGFGGCGEIKTGKSSIKERAEKLGVKLTTIDVGEDLIKIIKDPKHGFGKNMNPCMDCHLLFFRKCGEYMKKRGASFVITGEVLGERPMSQRRDAINAIEKESGLKGLIVRPLSGKLMPETIPEEKGWIDRRKLLDIRGRSRKKQMELAEKYGIDYYPNPAGGCQLTYAGFSRKVKDLIDNKPDFDMNDIKFLNFGRHFRLSENAKLAVGRDEKENKLLMEFSRKEDTYFNAPEVPGPIGIARGKLSRKDIDTAARIIARYSDTEEAERLKVVFGGSQKKLLNEVEVLPAGERELKTLRI